jgi:hypothetical protein
MLKIKIRGLIKTMLPKPTLQASAQSKNSNKPNPQHPLLHKFQYIFLSIQAHLSLQINRMKQWRFTLWAQNYNASQWCYFVACLLLLFTVSSDLDFMEVAALIAFIGLVRELITIFHKVWETTIGKSITLITYASTANLALAFAAMKINFITGVEPSAFIFTLGFTTLVLMPLWIAFSSIILFLSGLILANLWLLFSLPLKLFGIHLTVHWEDKKHALITMLMRIILIPVVLISLTGIILPYVSSTLSGTGININYNSDATDKVQSDSNSITINADNVDVDTIQAQADVIDALIANFIFYLEAYPNSACKKAPSQRSVILDDFSVLLISKEETAAHGFTYLVAKCEPRYE